MIKTFNNIINKYTTKNSILNRLAKALMWNVIGLLFSKGFTMVSSIVIARILGTTLYGEYGIIISTVSMFATLAGLGLGITSTKFVAEYRLDDKKKVERVLGLTNLFSIFSGTIMVILVYFFADTLAVSQLNNPNLANLLKIASILLLINTFNGVQRGSLSGFEKFSTLAKIDIFSGILSCVITLVGTIFWGLVGLVIANVVVNMVTVILCTISIRETLKQNNMKINYKHFYKECNVFIHISLPSMLSGLMVGPVTWIVNTLFIQIPNGYSQMGIFNAANQWRLILSMLPQVINLAILPILISNKNQSNKGLEKINLLLSWILICILALPLITIPELISYLYGKEYISYQYNITVILVILTTVFIAYKEGVARAMLSQSLMWRGFTDNLVWAITLICSIMIFRELGAIGMALSFLCAYIVSTLIFIPYNIYKKTIDRRNIFSKEIIIIWGIIIVQCLFTILNVTLWLRLIFLLLNLLSICICILFVAKQHKN